MKRPKSHQICERSKQIFLEAIPPNWVANEQYQDYGKDYIVETCNETDQLTGDSFYVQLKGKRQCDLSRDNDAIRFQLRTKHCKYYLDRIRDLPIFLIVIDLETQKGYWLFLQEYLGTLHEWRSKTGITVYVPIKNDITSTCDILDAVKHAKQWMRINYPEAIHELIAAKENEIHAKDNRFSGSLSVINGEQIIRLQPTHTVECKCIFTGQPDVLQPKLKDLLDDGKPVSFSPGELEIEGSRLFEDIKTVGCKLQIQKKIEATLDIVSMASDGREIAQLLHIPGTISGGQKNSWFHGELAKSPFTVNIGPLPPETKGTFKVTFDPNRWNGQNILQLAYFDRLESFLTGTKQSANTIVTLSIDGNTVLESNIPLHNEQVIDRFHRHFLQVKQARFLAKYYDVNPTWKAELFDEDMQNMTEQLFVVSQGETWARKMPFTKLRIGFKKQIPSSMKEELRTTQELKIVDAYIWDFFGNRIETDRLAFNYTNMRISDTDNPNNKQHINGRASHCSKRDHSIDYDEYFVGNEDTILTVRRATKDE